MTTIVGKKKGWFECREEKQAAEREEGNYVPISKMNWMIRPTSHARHPVVKEEEVVSAPKVADKKRKEQDNPNPRKVKLPKLDLVRSPSPEFEHQQKKKEKTGVQKGKKRSHHRREECPICKKEIYDILCHLWKHAEKGDIGADEVMHITSVAKRKGWRRSTSLVGNNIM